jgi:hypothetical protein
VTIVEDRGEQWSEMRPAVADAKQRFGVSMVQGDGGEHPLDR